MSKLKGKLQAVREIEGFMRIQLRLLVDRGTDWHIDLIAESKGEQAILYLLQESKELISEDNTSPYHTSSLTESLTLSPKEVSK